MKSLGKGWFYAPFVRRLLLLLFWGVWLALPFLIFDENDARHREIFLRLLPASLSNVLLFFVLAEWLGPYFLQRRQLRNFLFMVLGLSLLFIVLQGWSKVWLLNDEAHGLPFHMMRSLVHVFFSASLATGYALARYTFSEDKARQERLSSELSFLRSQISPHFIFNILNSIVYLIRSKSEQAEPVTLRLSALMRYMLYESGDAQIPLEKEVEYLQNYVELQKIRFEEDVEVKFAMEGRAEAQCIEPMLIIPFVENAFKHGVGMIKKPVIDIFLKIEPRLLEFRVRNKVSEHPAEEKDKSSGIGLQNVTRRLELLYPGRHRLEVGMTDGWFQTFLQISIG